MNISLNLLAKSKLYHTFSVRVCSTTIDSFMGNEVLIIFLKCWTNQEKSHLLGKFHKFL